MKQLALTFAVALLGGTAFFFLRAPLPWMLGPLAAMIIWAGLLRGRPCWPVKPRNTGLIIIGYMMGRAFTPETAGQIISQYPEMLLFTSATIAFSLLASYITYRQTGVSLASCVIGGVPGGLSQMTVLGEEIPSADGAIVALMQTIRVLAVVFCVPFLAINTMTDATGPVYGGSTGFTADALAFALLVPVATFAAVRVKLPTPYLTGPVLGTCALSVTGLNAPALPPSFIVAAQLCIGAYIGAGVKFDSLQDIWRRLVPYTLLNVGLVIAFSLGLGFMLSRITGMNAVTGFLSTAPGGMAEMGVTAMVVNADLSTVVAYQLFRVLFILLVLPLILKRWLGGG